MTDEQKAAIERLEEAFTESRGLGTPMLASAVEDTLHEFLCVPAGECVCGVQKKVK